MGFRVRARYPGGYQRDRLLALGTLTVWYSGVKAAPSTCGTPRPAVHPDLLGEGMKLWGLSLARR